MRTWALALFLVALFAGAANRHLLAQSDRAATVLSATREALGGDQRISAVRTFIATGRTRQLRGDNLVPIEFEIQAELPDKYSRRDELPAQDAGPRPPASTANAWCRFRLRPHRLARAGGPPPPAEQQAAAVAGADRWTQAGFRAPDARHVCDVCQQLCPLTFTYAGQAEAPQGKADVIDVTGPANFAARFFVDSQTHLPLMLTWQAPAAWRSRCGTCSGNSACRTTDVLRGLSRGRRAAAAVPDPTRRRRRHRRGDDVRPVPDQRGVDPRRFETQQLKMLWSRSHMAATIAVGAVLFLVLASAELAAAQQASGGVAACDRRRCQRRRHRRRHRHC